MRTRLVTLALVIAAATDLGLATPAAASFLPGRVVVKASTSDIAFAGSRLVLGTIDKRLCPHLLVDDLSGHVRLDRPGGASPGQARCSGMAPSLLAVGDGLVGWTEETIGTDETAGIYRVASLTTGRVRVLATYDLQGVGSGRTWHLAGPGPSTRGVGFAVAGDGAGLLAWSDQEGVHRVTGAGSVLVSRRPTTLVGADSGRLVVVDSPETTVDVVAAHDHVLLSLPADAATQPLFALRRDRLAVVAAGELRVYSVPGASIVHTLAVPTSVSWLAMSQGYVAYVAGGDGGSPYALHLVHLADEKGVVVVRSANPIEAAALGSPGLAYESLQHPLAVRLLSLARLRALAP